MSNQRDLAEKLYINDPELALEVALGNQTPPDGMQAAAVYGKVCEVAESTQNIEMCMLLANSLHNSKISIDAKNLKYISSNSSIAKMKEVVNARIKAFEKNLPKGKTYKMVIDEQVKELENYHTLLIHHIKNVVSTQNDIQTEIDEIKNRTKQYLKEDEFIKQLWILRYSCLWFWLLDITEPRNQGDLATIIALVNHSFESIEDISSYLPWLNAGLIEFNGGSQLTFDNLKKFKSLFAERVAERMVKIAFECTGGRLGGDQHDSIIELIKTTIESDKKSFYIED